MSTAHNGLEQEVRKYLLRTGKEITMAEMLLKTYSDGFLLLFVCLFLRIFNTASLQINRRGKEDK